MFGNLSPPDEVINAVVESVQSMRFNGYAPSTGKKFHQPREEELTKIKIMRVTDCQMGLAG